MGNKDFDEFDKHAARLLLRLTLAFSFALIGIVWLLS